MKPTIPVTLDPRPSRALTSREVAGLLGSVLGGLAGTGTSAEEILVGLRWWTDNDGRRLMTMLRLVENAARPLVQEIVDQIKDAGVSQPPLA